MYPVVGVVVFFDVKLVNKVIVCGDFLHIDGNQLIRGGKQSHQGINGIVNGICPVIRSVL